MEVGAGPAAHAAQWTQLEAQWKVLLQEYSDDMQAWSSGIFWSGDTWMDVQFNWAWEHVMKLQKAGKVWRPYSLERAQRDAEGATSSEEHGWGGAGECGAHSPWSSCCLKACSLKVMKSFALVGLD